MKETLRLRPVVPGVGRVVRGEPFELGGYMIPPGIEINPSIAAIHRRADCYPDPAEFRPERFLGADAPDTYTWLPFGGGDAALPGRELRHLRDAGRDPPGARADATSSRSAAAPRRRVRKGVTIVPKRGVRVVQPNRPAAGDDAAGARRAPRPVALPVVRGLSERDLRDWIARQSLFFVGTAPLGGDGHVNLSPKGPIGTLCVLGPHDVAYLDLIGSGAETIAHLRENGRIVVMLCAFEGPPRILRLHGRGEVVMPPDPALRRAPRALRIRASRRSRSRGGRSCVVDVTAHRRLMRLRRAAHVLRGPARPHQHAWASRRS